MADPGLQPVNLLMLFLPYACAILIVGVRLWKRTHERKYSLDDALITIAMVINTGLTISTYLYIKKSYTGYKIENIPKGAVNKITTAKLRYVNSVTYNPALNLIKISFLVTLIKLQSPNRWIRRCLWVFLAITVMFAVAISVTAMVSCVPIARFWDRRIPGTCRNSQQFIYASNTTTILTDLLVTIMPAWILHNLQMSRKNKIVISCFLSLGLVVTAITAYRLVFFIHLFRINDPVRNENPYNIRTPLSNLEINLSAIAACGPTVKWLLGRFIPFFDSAHKPSSTYHYSQNNSSRYNKERSKRSFKMSKDDTNLDMTIIEDGDYSSKNVSAVEMKDQIGWKGTRYHADADAQSDEHRMTGEDGIVKTVEWNVIGNGKDVRHSPTQPRNMI